MNCEIFPCCRHVMQPCISISYSVLERHTKPAYIITSVTSVVDFYMWLFQIQRKSSFLPRGSSSFGLPFWGPLHNYCCSFCWIHAGSPLFRTLRRTASSQPPGSSARTSRRLPTCAWRPSRRPWSRTAASTRRCSSSS